MDELSPEYTKQLLHALETARASGSILWRLIKLASQAGGVCHEALELHRQWVEGEINDEGRRV